jgi:hypothetical protein
VVSAVDPPRSLISVFYTGAATSLSSISTFIHTRAEWTAFQTQCYSENVTASGIEIETSGLAEKNSDVVWMVGKVGRISTEPCVIQIYCPPLTENRIHT